MREIVKTQLSVKTETKISVWWGRWYNQQILCTAQATENLSGDLTWDAIVHQVKPAVNEKWVALYASFNFLLTYWLVFIIILCYYYVFYQKQNVRAFIVILSVTMKAAAFKSLPEINGFAEKLVTSVVTNSHLECQDRFPNYHWEIWCDSLLDCKLFNWLHLVKFRFIILVH